MGGEYPFFRDTLIVGMQFNEGEDDNVFNDHGSYPDVCDWLDHFG